MNISSDFIYGMSLGAEYVPANEDEGIDFPCIILDLLILRVVVELTDS